MAEIVLDGISKWYRRGEPIIRDIDLTIDDEEFLILVGPSGCGKSTLLNMIAGLEDISEGELRIGGKRVNETVPQARNIAMVFQSYALYPHMSVRENIAFPLNIAKQPKAEIKRKVDEAAEILELTELLDRRPGELSGGQRQRVAMGRAIVRQPEAFLMDEPLSNLDAKLRAQMRTSISRLQKSLATTTVYVTHDQTEAMTLGDRIVVLRDGIAQQIGSPADLYERPANLFVAGFIGSPTMNFLPGRIAEGKVRTAIGHLPLGDRVRRELEDTDADREVIVGLRPEAFEDDRFAGGGADRFGFTDTVDIVESLGSVKLAYFNLDEPAQSDHLTSVSDVIGGADRFGSAQLTAQIDARSAAREGDDLRVSFNPHDALLFEPDTGRRIGHLVLLRSGGDSGETSRNTTNERLICYVMTVLYCSMMASQPWVLHALPRQFESAGCSWVLRRPVESAGSGLNGAAGGPLRESWDSSSRCGSFPQGSTRWSPRPRPNRSTLRRLIPSSTRAAHPRSWPQRRGGRR